MQSPTTVLSPAVTAGRMKENVSGDKALLGTAMSASSLSAMSFELPANFQVSKDPAAKVSDVPDAMYASSSSSTCTRESDAGAYSDADSTAPRLPPARLDRGVSDMLNAKITKRLTSRQGRSTQRWVTESNESIRLVTGCVPILKGGKIMFVSASRKPEWILPKGGWEKDEAMEESAIRECFEEAGVLGVLGPKLQEVEYETRKAKKRRLEQEEIDRNCKAKNETGSPSSENDSSLEGHSSSTLAPLTDEAIARIRVEAKTSFIASGYQSEGKASTSSSTYSKVRMTLFPLYVSQVMEKWPEDGRFRKAVDIDEAIKMLDSRPELKEVLEEVKKRELHLLSERFPSPSAEKTSTL
mmetsp:Transcript_37481/g.77752  ORF Transcript_37481/g.77752 Transcript_37481/m.77752 type:complete len:355 (-) Transcript_37481:1826-2890(-)|eukprot:CAMPEP_0172455754 /NCGR_PEP_ID=MMETSP1065-20121228/12230_1 /TAXON_ID=265537 /ORGANISM="Amphiprora paludosa, Strain CCMP125" /LENGTH=354 /DNA_ID=CAMNT_0013208227 /DNA_START=357 /DNA_END=1421 /DNA_ORIENTATION=-